MRGLFISKRFDQRVPELTQRNKLFRRHAARMIGAVSILIKREMLFDNRGAACERHHRSINADRVIAKSGVLAEVYVAEMEIS